MKSTLLNMVSVLAGICLVASACVGAVYTITAEPIAQAKAQATVDALSNVLPEFDNDPSDRVVELTLNDMPIKVYTATLGGEVAGYAVETMTKEGFGGAIRMMVGFLPSGEVNNVNVLEQAETPGLGTKMCDEGNPLIESFKGKNPAAMKMSVTKDGGDVQALTAATISSRAYVDAMSRAYAALTEVRGAEADAGADADAEADADADADAATGATLNESQPTQEGDTENE